MVIASGVLSRPANSRAQIDKLTTSWVARGSFALLKMLGTVHCLLYRASRGRLARCVRGAPVLLLTTTGRRSGRPRTWPVCYLPAGNRDVIVVASAGGASRHPGWYVNLRANSRVTAQLDDQTRVMCARTTEGVERAQLWERVIRQYPICTNYQHKTARVIPVVVLSPIPDMKESSLILAKG